MQTYEGIFFKKKRGRRGFCLAWNLAPRTRTLHFFFWNSQIKINYIVGNVMLTWEKKSRISKVSQL
jgi:hypothetical protein